MYYKWSMKKLHHLHLFSWGFYRKRLKIIKPRRQNPETEIIMQVHTMNQISNKQARLQVLYYRNKRYIWVIMMKLRNSGLYSFLHRITDLAGLLLWCVPHHFLQKDFYFSIKSEILTSSISQLNWNFHFSFFDLKESRIRDESSNSPVMLIFKC